MTTIAPTESAPELKIDVTPKAVDKIRQAFAKQGVSGGLRLGVLGGGCSGLSYQFKFDAKPRATDHVFTYGDVQVFVDPKSLVYIDGTELDFVREGLNEGFKFNNPNVRSECGCGESFNV